MKKPSPHVAILLGTYNGANYIDQQLASYASQTFTNWSLWASDDGSKDETFARIAAFSRSCGRPVHVLEGPRKGVCHNFQSMTDNEHIQADYFAFSDQDDIWMDDKLERAVAWLARQDPKRPALYCSRTHLIDSKGDRIGFSPDNTRPPSLANALLQNIASGNTMVFNRSARELMQCVAHLPMVIHDWALYLIVTACGGKVIFDSRPTVYYRQHSSNLIGNGMAVKTRIKNFLSTHQGKKAVWNDIHFHLLDVLVDRLTPASKECLMHFQHIRHSPLLTRMNLMHKSGIYHQTFIGTLATWSYALFDRL